MKKVFIVDILDNNGIDWVDDRCKKALLKDISIFLNISYTTLQRLIERYKEKLEDDIELIKGNNDILLRLKERRKISKKTPQIMLIKPEGVIKLCFITKGEIQNKILNELMEDDNEIYTQYKINMIEPRRMKKYQNELGYLLDNIFYNHNIKHEKYVEGYRIDYLIDDSVAVECDEIAHDYYDEMHEKMRSSVMEKYKYKFFRYDVRCGNMLNFIGDIVEYMINAVH